jgi:hypothetical protein
MAEIQGGITIGPGILIGPKNAIPTDFITEDSNFLISEDDKNLIEE